MQENQQNPLLVPASILVAGVIIGAAILYSGGVPVPNQGASVAEGLQEQEQEQGEVDIEGEPFIGQEDAPIVMAYWFDFQCPFCQQFEQQTLPQIIEEYVDTGKVRIVFKDLQFLGSHSVSAGLVSKAVWETAPKRYLEWQEAMFEAQDAENGGWGSEEDVLALTRDLGFDIQAVESLLEENRDEYKAEQNLDRAEAASFGITGTPGFLLAGRLISGAQPYDVFAQAIDEALSEK